MSDQTRSNTGRIVVGVDGSPAAQAALRWAIRHAQLTGDSVEAVIAWQFPVIGASYGWAGVAVTEGIDLRPSPRRPLPRPSTRPPDPIRPSPSSSAWWRATRRACWSRSRRPPSCSWSAAGVTARSPRPCSVRSASTARTTRGARSSSCAADRACAATRDQGPPECGPRALPAAAARADIDDMRERLLARL